MKKKAFKMFKAVFFPLPFILGFIGLYFYDVKSFEMAIYSCIKMYTFGYAGDGVNVFIILARWLGPLATLSGVIMVFSAVRNKIRSYIMYKRGESVAVYGPSDERAAMLTLLGKRGINIDKKFIRARRYILLGNDKDNLSFYNQNRTALSDAEVYMRCCSVQAEAVNDVHLHVFCPEEAAARLFWKNRGVYELTRERGNSLKIVLIGSGELIEKVLESALIANIFSPDQHIEYHVFGNCDEFRAIHTSLDQISDPVVFHSEPWYQSTSLIEQSDLAIILEQDDQLALIEKLLLATKNCVFDVFAANRELISLIDDGRRLKLYDWKSETQKPELIFTDKLFENAKKINLKYASVYGGVEESPENLETEWKKLDPFTRHSNISAADYHSIRLKMLEADGLPADAEKLSPDVIERLSELEHIRWCRYHYLNNWTYGVPENGRTKDTAKRIHCDLLPYGELSDSEKDKDRDSVRLLLSIIVK